MMDNLNSLVLKKYSSGPGQDYKGNGAQAKW